MPILVNLPSRGAVLRFPDGTTPEQIQAAVDRDFPRAGQDVAYDLHDSDFHSKRMTLGDYQMFREYNAENEKSASELVKESTSMLTGEMGAAFKEAWAGVKRGDIGEVAESAFMGSMTGVFDIGDIVVRMIAERKEAPDTYDEFLKDTNLKADAASRAKFDKLMKHDFKDFKDQMDRQGAREAFIQKMPLPEVARGAAWVDPTIAVPVIGLEGLLVKAGAKVGRVAGKTVEVGGRGVAKFGEGAGRMVTAGAERVGAGIERATGLTPAQAATAARYGLPGGAATLMGGPVAGAAIGAGVTVAPRAIGATGRVIEQAGIGLQQGVGRAGFFGGAAGRLAEGTLEHNLARGLSLLDRPLAYGVHGVSGASIGAGFGGVLGGLAEGREGFWHGVGAGGVLGGTLGIGMRGISDLAGLAGKAKLHADLRNTADALRAAGDEAGALNFERAMDSWDGGSLAILNDARRMTKRHHWHYVDDAAAKAMTDGAGFDGLHTIDRGDGTADVFINVDKLPFDKDGKPISSAAGEELFHSLVAEDVKKEFISQLQTDLLGIEGYMSGMIHPWELRTYGEAYGGLLKGEAKADFLARLDEALPKDAAGNIAIGDRMKLLDITEEWGAGYFREWLKGKPRDFLLDKGRLPLLTSAFDRAKQSFLTTRRDTLNEAGARFDFRSGDIRKGFYDANDKRIRMPLLDKMMQDFVRAKRTGEVPKIDSTTHAKISLKKIGGEKAAILMEQQGSHMVERLPDGTARVRKVEEVKAIEKEQSDMFLEAVERGAPETGAMIREDAEGWQITMTPKAVEGIMNHPMIDEAFKQRFGQVMESIFGQGDIFKMSYWKATESKRMDPAKREYLSLGLSERKVRFYDLRINKEGGIYTMSADWSILEKRMNKLWGRTDVKALFDADRVLFNNEFRRYLENLTSPDPRPSAELFGVKQRDIFRDAVGPRATEFVRNPITFEAIGSKREALNAFKSFRIDRMSRLDQTGEAMPFTGETYGHVKVNLMPSAETRIKRRFMRTTEEGAKPKQPELFDPDLIKAAKLKIKKSRTLHPEALPLKPKLEKDGKTLKIGERTDRETGETVRDVEFAQEPYKLLTAPVFPKGLNRAGASAKPPYQRAVTKGADLLVDQFNKWSKNPDIMAGKGWYGKMRGWLQENFGASMETFSQLLGATSARTGVADNFTQSRMAIRKFSQGDYDGLLQRFDQHVMSVKEKADSGALFAEWKIRNPKKPDSHFDPITEHRKAINLFDEVPLKDNGTKYNANSMAVLKSLYGNWLETTKGPKTPNFAGNLTGRTLEATIDVWAARLLRRLLYSGKRKRWRILPEQEAGVGYGQTKTGEYTGDFVFAQKIFREAADRLGMSPDDLQAVVWFGEKDVWTKNGWTGSEGKKKSSFEEQASKMEVERFTAGVTTYRGKESFDPVVFEQARTFLKEKAATNPDLLAARVTESEGYYGREMEPTFDAEFSLNKNANLHDIVEAVLDVGGDPRFTQDDVFISAIVSESHPNARPSIEVGFKSPATKVQADAVMEAFLAEGVDGFTLAKDERGNVIGIRAQYIPEISGRWESGHLSHKDFLRNKANWLVKLKKAVANLDKGVISYAEARNVSTIVYGREEYRSAGVLDPRGSDARSELGRRRHNLQTRAGRSETRTSRFMPSESSRREPSRGRGGVRPDDAGTSAGLATSKRFMPDVGGQDALGMFSAAERATVNLKQEKGTASQMLAMIKKSGVKDEELQVLGLDKFLEGNRRVSKDEIIDHLVENSITVEEVLLGEIYRPNRLNEIRSRFDEIHVEERNLFISADRLAELNSEKAALSRELQDLGSSPALRGEVKHASYVEPGAVEGSYRELLLKLPGVEPSTLREVVDINEALKLLTHNDPTLRWQNEDASIPSIPITKQVQLSLEATANHNDAGYRIYSGRKPTDSYTGGHYGDTPNVLAHARVNDRIGPKGEKILHGEEFQSDWHQAGRKQGYRMDAAAEAKAKAKLEDDLDVASKELVAYRNKLEASDLVAVHRHLHENDPVYREISLRRDSINEQLSQRNRDLVPDAPFKTSWHELLMKRMLKYSVDNGYDALSWTKGETQFKRYGSQEIAWKRTDDVVVEGKGWRVKITNQRGEANMPPPPPPAAVTHGTLNIEALRAERLLSEGGVGVASKSELRSIIEDTLLGSERGQYSKENFDKRVNKLTDSVWKRMQTEDAGTSLPRKEGMQHFYDRMLTDRKFWKKLGLKVESQEFKDVEYNARAARTTLMNLAEHHASGRLAESDAGAAAIFKWLENQGDWGSPTGDPSYGSVFQKFAEMKESYRAGREAKYPSNTTDKSWKIVEAELDKHRINLPVHIVRLTPEVKAKVLDGGLARFMPDSGAPNTSRNALGWSLIESKVGKWHVYRPDGTLAGIGGSKRSAENLFRTHYKRELRKSERAGKTRFMPDTGSSRLPPRAEQESLSMSIWGLPLTEKQRLYIDKDGMHILQTKWAKPRTRAQHEAGKPVGANGYNWQNVRWSRKPVVEQQESR